VVIPRKRGRVGQATSSTRRDPSHWEVQPLPQPWGRGRGPGRGRGRGHGQASRPSSRQPLSRQPPSRQPSSEQPRGQPRGRPRGRPRSRPRGTGQASQVGQAGRIAHQRKDPLTISDIDSDINTSSSHESLSLAEHNMWVERARRVASPIWKAKDIAEQAAIKAREAENRKALEAEK
jgi:hypothetical protein